MIKETDWNPKDSGRYPYTYAADLIRIIAGYNEKGIKISRSDASQIRSKISSILGLNDKEVAKKLADYFLEHENKLTYKSVEVFLNAKGDSI